ncbi:MAG: glycosyltransferase [Bacteroides sp.]|nr:glycosyltransferase [Bacteroides sp.]
MKKRILFLISCLLDGGIDTALIEYLRGIDTSLYDVTLAIGMKMEGMEVHRGRIPSEVKVVYLVDEPRLLNLRRRRQTGHLPGALKIYDELLLNPVRRYRSARRLQRLTAEADLVVDFDATFYTPLRECRVPVVGFYHFSIEENLRRSERHTRRQMAGMATYKRIALVSDTMVEEGRRLFPELASKFVRIYNGYNLAEFRSRAQRNPGLSLPERYFVAVERLEESQKDLTTLIRAYAKAGGAESGFPYLLLVGEGRDRNRLMELAKECGVGEKVIFAGFQPEVPAIMHGAMALLHSSKYEGFGLVLAEALILGKPVVSTDTPTGPAEVLDGGRAGELLPVGDVEEMSRCIRRLAEDAPWREELAKRAERRGDLFDIRASLKELLKF